MDKLTLNIRNPKGSTNIELFGNNDSLFYYLDSSNFEFTKEYELLLGWDKELYPILYFKRIANFVYIFKSTQDRINNTNALARINIETGEIIRLPAELQSRTEHFSINGGTYTMFYRAAIMPDRTMINTFKCAVAHTATVTNFIFRISKDGGLTFKGANGIAAYDIVEVAGLDTDTTNNPTPFVTADNRIYVFLQIYNSSNVRYKTAFVYSEDLGLTWTNIIDFPTPPIAEIMPIYAPYFIAAEPVYLQNGNFILPYWVRVTEIGRTMILIAEFNENGTVNSNYSTVYDGRTGNLGEIVEPEWTYLGNGEIVMICRWDRYPNLTGDNVPVLMYSSDYGLNWASGSGTALLRTDIDNKLYKSGFAYLEGAGVSMGDNNYFNIPVPTINALTINSTKWLLVNYWIREQAGELNLYTIQRMNIIKFDDYKLLGVDAIKDIAITLFDETVENVGNENGGNGNGVVYGEEILFFQYTQPTLDTTAWTVPIRRNVIDSLITAYNSI